MSDLWGLHTAAEGEDDDHFILHHHTTPEAAKTITDSGVFTPGERESGVWFTSQEPNAFRNLMKRRWGRDFGTSVIPMRIPVSEWERLEGEGKDFSGLGETGDNWSIYPEHVNPEWIQPVQHLTDHHTASTDGIRYAHLVEADVANDLMRLAMAWNEWSDSIQHLYESPEGLPFSAGRYHIDHDGGGQSSLSYLHLPEHKRLDIQMLQTEPGYERRGVAESLMRRLHSDYPDHQIDPSGMTDEGQAFHDRMLEKEPSAKSMMARLAMPAPLPEGIHFTPFARGDETSRLIQDTYPDINWPPGPGIAAHLPGHSAPVGHIEWLDDNDADEAAQYGEPKINPGEVSYINVDDSLRRHSIGTELFDQARRHEPRVHHSQDRTELGQKWIGYEESRNPVMARRIAMPASDAYDPGVRVRPDEPPIPAGPWYHASDEDFEDGFQLTSPRARNHYPSGVNPDHPRNDWVWLSDSPEYAQHYGPNLYEVEPQDEGPWPWNGQMEGKRFVAPRARIIRKISPHTAARVAMPNPLPQGVFFRYHPELMWSPGVTAHAPGGKQIGSLEWYDDDHVMVDLGTRKPGEIDRISVAPEHQGNSVATSMFDFAKQYEPRLHHSDTLTEDGEGWSAYEKSRNARLAMAWDEWAPQVQHWQSVAEPGYGGTYYVEHHDLPEHPLRGVPQSYLHYSHSTPGQIDINMLYTHEAHRSDGVAESLIRRLHQDNPGYKINPGAMTSNGQAFHDRMLDKEPDARGLVTAGANGELPENLTFQHHPAGPGEFPDVITPSVSVSHAFPTVSAHDGDKMVGYLQWYDDHPRKKGEIWDLRVHPDYQRRGIGTALFDWTTDKIEPDLHHSNNLSDEGRAFAEAEVARPLADERYEAWRNKQPMPKRFAGRNGPPPPMTFKPFNTYWSNGIMARHAEDGRPLAHLHWYPDGEIESIRVHPEMQGRDIGKHILAHAVMNPDTYEAPHWGIQPSNHMTEAGRAYARSLGYNPPDDEVTPANNDVNQWGWTAVKDYVPLRIPYTGQNEDEMSEHLGQPWTPPQRRTASADDEGWPVWWRGRHRPAGPFDKRWHPNHPEHIPAPWDN